MAHHHQSETGSARGVKAYWPLVVIIVLVTLAAAARQIYREEWSWMFFMAEFMGLFFLIFSMFKFFDLKGFVEGFSMYDLMAGKYPAYGYAYPFIELFLGLAYLSMTNVILTSAITFVLMAFSAAGVIRAVWQGMDYECACLGTLLKVPLSTVSIVENIGMGLMALWMLVVAVF